MAGIKSIKKNTSFVSELDTSNFEHVSQQHELLVNEIESTEGHLGTALKSVYEMPEPERFFDCLDSRIKSHDKEIERMCNHHYQGFIESVRSLLQVRSDVDKLKHEIEFVDSELRASGNLLLSKASAMVDKRRTQENIETTISLLNSFLPVLQMYRKLQKQMDSKRYYPALKTLELLEHTLLPQISSFTIGKKMEEEIPEKRRIIKEASMTELKDFLENLRKYSSKIGQIAMKQTAQENQMDPLLVATEIGRKKQAPDPPSSQPLLQSPRNQTTFSVINFSEDSEECTLAQDLIDFSPVYRCFHICSVLGEKEDFEKYYRAQRKKQCRLALDSFNTARRMNQASDSSLKDNLDFYKNYFNEVVGFFVIEDHILHTTQGLLTRSLLDQSWEKSLVKIIAVLRTNFILCSDTQMLLNIKNLIFLFNLSLKSYGFNTNQLFELLLEVRDHHSNVLRKEWMNKFSEIFENDNYTPIKVENEKQFQHILFLYPYQDPLLEKQPFPKKFPFSQFVPAVFCEVKRYIQACLEFSDDLKISNSEKSDKSRFSLYKLTKEELTSSLLHFVEKKNPTLFQLIQISINMEHLDKSCVFLEDFISHLSGVQIEKNKASKLHGQSMFKSAKSEAESEIFKQIDLKIDKFFDLANYDYEAEEPPKKTSEFIDDLISFLSIIFNSFNNLPEKVAQTACMSACKHMAEKLATFLRAEEVKVITEFFLQQINLDLSKCEEFAMTTPVSGMDPENFRLAFEDLRQLLDLLVTEEWSRYISDYNKPKHKYMRVQPQICIQLLEKLKEAEKRRTKIFSTFKKNERDRKRLYDATLKQLRTLTY